MKKVVLALGATLNPRKATIILSQAIMTDQQEEKTDIALRQRQQK